MVAGWSAPQIARTEEMTGAFPEVVIRECDLKIYHLS